MPFQITNGGKNHPPSILFLHITIVRPFQMFKGTRIESDMMICQKCVRREATLCKTKNYAPDFEVEEKNWPQPVLQRDMNISEDIKDV